MKKNKKKQSIASKVVIKMTLIMCFINLCLTLDIWYILEKRLAESEEQYMTEVITRVTLEINSELNNYITAAESVATSKILHEFLMTVEEDTVQGHGSTLDVEGVEGFEDAMNELKIVTDMFQGSVLRVAICSVYKDNFLTHEGERGDETFSLASLPFYNEVVNKKNTYISDPYDDVLTKAKIIAIAVPIFDENNMVIGMITVEFTTEQLTAITSSAVFGDSGNTFLVDRNQNVLVYPEESYIGQPVTALNIEGTNLLSELQNPSGEIMEYNKNGIHRTGGVTKINDLTGWSMVAAMDSSEFEGSVVNVIQKLVFAQLMILILTLGVCIRNIYKSTAPIKELEEFMEKLADGDLSATIHYKSHNEIGRLAHHMNTTAENLSIYISQIETSMDSFQQGDFTLPENMDYMGDFRSIQKSMEHFVVMMTGSLRKLDRAIKEVNEGATQVSSGAKVLAKGSTKQSLSIEELNTLIANINETLLNTAENSGFVTKDVQKIQKELTSSNDKMQDLVTSVIEIQKLSEQVKQIIKSIEDVAFQTNILSLNASIEAARAGTGGKGFSQVAEEVRNLSEKTAKAVEETTVIINEIARAILIGAALAKTTSKDLQLVVNDVNIFVEKISNISLSTQDQAETIAEISKGIQEISNVVHKNNAISQSSADASGELSTQSQRMLTLVEQFKLKNP